MKVMVDLNVLADFLAKVMGDHTEIAIHQLDNLEASLVHIHNGHITGRKEGMPATDLALKMVQELSDNPDAVHKINYLSLAKEGKKLRSSSLLICDDDQMPRAVLCINQDDSPICQMIRQLRKMTTIEDTSEIKEDFYANVQSMKTVHEKIIEDVIARSPIPVSHLSVDEKVLLVKELSEKGIFLIKGSIELVAKAFSISEPTLYRYLKQIDH